jgi:hypothetical protein
LSRIKFTFIRWQGAICGIFVTVYVFLFQIKYFIARFCIKAQAQAKAPRDAAAGDLASPRGNSRRPPALPSLPHFVLPLFSLH